MEIVKFKAWDRKNKKWYLPPHPFDSSIGGSMMTFDGRVYISGVYQDLELYQFTGQVKHGIEIYEGAIGILGEYCCVLEYSVREARFWWIDVKTRQWITGRPSDAKIIGHIRDNPEVFMTSKELEEEAKKILKSVNMKLIREKFARE